MVKVAGLQLTQLVVVSVIATRLPAHSLQEVCTSIRLVILLCCRAANVPVLVDGAHAVGILPDLNVSDLGCQYYTTNLHKWMCTPKVIGHVILCS